MPSCNWHHLVGQFNFRLLYMNVLDAKNYFQSRLIIWANTARFSQLLTFTYPEILPAYSGPLTNLLIILRTAKVLLALA
jgi:hypothetical protein